MHHLPGKRAQELPVNSADKMNLTGWAVTTEELGEEQCNNSQGLLRACFLSEIHMQPGSLWPPDFLDSSKFYL